MIIKTRNWKLWSDEGVEFKRASKKFYQSKGIDSHTLNRGPKHPFAERHNQSPKNIVKKTFGEPMELSLHKRKAVVR